jgi:hypothetical protein
LDTVEFQHAYLSIPTPSSDDRVVHGMQVLTRALTGAPSPTTISQPDAITQLHDLFKSWHQLAPPTIQQLRIPAPERPRVVLLESPRVVPSPTIHLPTTSAYSAPRLCPPPRPTFQATPQCITFINEQSPRVPILMLPAPAPRVEPLTCPPASNVEPSPKPTTTLPIRVPIAHRTRSCVVSQANLSIRPPFHPHLVHYQVPTSKFIQSPMQQLGFAGLCEAASMTPKEVNGFAYLCKALTLMDHTPVEALSVLD